MKNIVQALLNMMYQGKRSSTYQSSYQGRNTTLPRQVSWYVLAFYRVSYHGSYQGNATMVMGA